jgi:hypothetical protein
VQRSSRGGAEHDHGEEGEAGTREENDTDEESQRQQDCSIEIVTTVHEFPLPAPRSSLPCRLRVRSGDGHERKWPYR